MVDSVTLDIDILKYLLDIEDLQGNYVHPDAIRHKRTLSLLGTPIVETLKGDADIDSFLMMFDACNTIVYNEDLSADELKQASGYVRAPSAAAVLNGLSIVTKHRGYHDVLSQSNEAAAIWRHEIAVRELYAMNCRKDISGNLVKNVPFDMELQTELYYPNWIKPFPKMHHRNNWWRKYDGASVLDNPWLDINSLKSMLIESDGKLIVAGSMALDLAQRFANYAEGENYDIDMFFTGVIDIKSASALIEKNVMGWLRTREGEDKTAVLLLTENALTVWMPCKLSVQFILRLYHSIEQVFLSFDKGVCSHAWDGNSCLALPRAIFSIQHGMNITDPVILTTPKRTEKYCKRGFVEAIPVPDARRANDTLDRARDCTPDELREIADKGGFSEIAAYLAKRDSPAENMEWPDSVLYQAFSHPAELLDDDFRKRFLEKFPTCRVHILDKISPIYPQELRDTLSERNRWKIEDPGERMYSTNGDFFNY